MMLSFLPLLLRALEIILMILGVVFWLWGTLPVLNKKHSIFYKLHALTVSDTVGSLCMLLALALHSPSRWVLLLTAAISLSLWNTFFSYILASVADR